MKKIAVVLTGCGFKDGSEITEAISTLIAIGQYGAQYQCFAPQLTFTATNHLNGEPEDTRNTLEESARIARGHIRPLSELSTDEFDAVIFPGGFGAALHLSDWAKQGSKASVLPEALRVVREFYQQSKPIGAICIAPTLIAKVLGDQEVTVTIGNDKETAQEIEKTGAIHENCEVTDYITDRAHKIVTTPAYMYDEATPFEVSQGINGLVKEVVEMA